MDYEARLEGRVWDLLERADKVDAKELTELYLGDETPDPLTASNVIAVMEGMGILKTLSEPILVKGEDPDATRFLEDESTEPPLDGLELFLSSSAAMY